MFDFLEENCIGSVFGDMVGTFCEVTSENFICWMGAYEIPHEAF